MLRDWRMEGMDGKEGEEGGRQERGCAQSIADCVSLSRPN